MPKISNLPAATDVTTDDYVVIVNAPGGTPQTQKATVGEIVMLAVADLAGTTFQGVWDSGTTYAEKDVVSYDGSVYIALAATTNDQPDTSPGVWQLWVPQGPPGNPGDPGTQGDPGDFGIPKAWLDTGYNSGVTYTRGDAIEHNGNTWVCVVETVSGDEPTDSSSNWQRILAKGAKPWTTPEAWDNATTYTAGSDHEPASAVTYAGSTYVCIVSHTSSGSFGSDLGDNKWILVASKGDTGPVASVLEGPYIEVTDPTGPDVTVGFKTSDFLAGPELETKLAETSTPLTNALWVSDTITGAVTVNATPQKILEVETGVVNELGGAVATQNYVGLVTGQVIIGQMDATTGYFVTVWVNTDWDGSEDGWDCTVGSDWLSNLDVTPGPSNQPAMAPVGGQQWNLWSLAEAKVGSTSQLATVPINAAVPYEIGKKLAVRVVVHCDDNSNPGLISHTWKSVYGTRVDLTPVPYYTAP